MAGDIHIGTSGWSYQEWKHGFYRNVPRRTWLEHYAQHFQALEINSTFYRLQSKGTLSSWANRTPDNFVFCAKGHRFVTHTKRLEEAEETIPRSRDNFLPLGPKLHSVLWQLPATFQKDLNRLEEFAQVLDDKWKNTRHAIELRHSTWMDEEVAELLHSFGVAACQSDAPDFRLWDVVTTDFAYVRLHGHTRKYASRYSPESMDHWTDKLRQWQSEGLDVYVFFDNTAEGAAPFDALELKERLQDETDDNAPEAPTP